MSDRVSADGRYSPTNASKALPKPGLTLSTYYLVRFCPANPNPSSINHPARAKMFILVRARPS